MVECVWRSYQASGYSGPVLSIPAGFRGRLRDPGNAGYLSQQWELFGSGSGRLQLTNGATLAFFGLTGGEIRGSVFWSPADAWPTVLPWSTAPLP